MSSSLSPATAVTNSANSSLLGGASRSTAGALLPPSAAQFREIHKNTWLKRLNADGKKVTVGPKKSERSWVVFCVHDDTEAVLEGYAEPRQAAAHSPEWLVSLQDTLHISHALIPNSHEFEFVVTLSNEVLRFHAMSWEIMQEWVETLRSKLREMKILSPRENLYTKLPEIRAPLLPTRDPTSPLPAPPPVPAAIVPGVERVVPQQQRSDESEYPRTISVATATTTTTTAVVLTETPTTAIVTPSITTAVSSAISTTTAISSTTTPNFTSMSNTLTQNLLNMLSDPISTYSDQINETAPNTDADGDIEDVIVVINNEQHSNSEQDLNLSDDEFLSPLLRKASILTENGVHVDITAGQRASADQLINLEHLLQCERLIPRPQTSRSQSAGAADKTKRLRRKDPTTPLTTKIKPEQDTPTTSVNNEASDNITIIQVSTQSNGTAQQSKSNINTESQVDEPPKLPTKTITADVFRFPDISTTKSKLRPVQAVHKQLEYKSNVQIIPSNSSNTSTIQVLGGQAASGQSVKVKPNQYSSPVKSISATTAPAMSPLLVNTTMVHVVGDETSTTTSITTSTSTSVAVYGSCYTPTANTTSTKSMPTLAAPQTTPKLSKKIILSAHSTGITNITVNNEVCGALSSTDNIVASSDIKHNVGNVHYEKVFLSSSIPIAAANILSTEQQEQKPRRQATNNTNISTASGHEELNNTTTSAVKVNTIVTTNPSKSQLTTNPKNSPVLPRRRAASPQAASTPTSALHATRPVLTRGLTEAVINTRPSRRDFHYKKLLNTPTKSKTNKNIASSSNTVSTNNNIMDIGASVGPTTSVSAATTPVHAVAVNRTNAAVVVESMEQRKRSSSTSDAQAPLQRTSATPRGANNNEFQASTRNSGSVLRIQQPPMPFRSSEHNVGGNNCSGATKRLTLREQQVMQLRREIMHPGGVRLQLRRKDCVGSIAWVDAFGAVWIAGWKQKEHPVLYNALHIGDQLLSIAGVSISNASEANKIIRNTNTLFVEVLVRRIPFGRAYAIRRDREGQCLGLIRDGNTSTIVDVVPNSLAARHGLPPKAQSCDGSTLTFWMLTEINGRPLNLFFKDNEIRDRLNSVGRDISILVQPSDLITKLKKQLKSLRGYKDYLVQ